MNRKTKTTEEKNAEEHRVKPLVNGRGDNGERQEPPCDRKSAHCAGEERGTMEWRRKKFSTLADASNCHPRAGTPGSSPIVIHICQKAGAGSSCRATLAEQTPPGLRSCNWQDSAADVDFFRHGTTRAPPERRQDVSDGSSGGCPPKPMCGGLRPGGVSKPIWREAERQRGQILCILAETCRQGARGGTTALQHHAQTRTVQHRPAGHHGTNNWPECWRSTTGVQTPTNPLDRA